MLKCTLPGLLLFAGLSSAASAETPPDTAAGSPDQAVAPIEPSRHDRGQPRDLQALLGQLRGEVVVEPITDEASVMRFGNREPGPAELRAAAPAPQRRDLLVAQGPGEPPRRPVREVSPEADPSREVHRLIGELQRIIDKQNRTQDEALKAARTPIADRVNQTYRTHGPVADLANTLRGMFVDSTIVAAPVSNSLLVSATQADAPIIEALLRQLDVSPARVRISVLVAELTDATETWEPKGTWDEARVELEALAAKGNGSILRRIQMSTLANQIASVQVGETVNLQVGRSFSPRGELPSYQAQQLGTMLTCTPRPDPEGQVTMEVAFEMSRLAPQLAKPTAPAPSEGSAGSGGAASSLGGPQRQSATVRTTVSIPKGKAISISDFATQDAGAPSRLILVVGCEVQ